MPLSSGCFRARAAGAQRGPDAGRPAQALDRVLGPGDLLRPLDDEEERLSPVPAVARYQVVHRARLAALIRDFSVRIARWPEVHAAIVCHAMRRARPLTYEVAAAQHGLTKQLLSHLANRWGAVTGTGVGSICPG